jgi:hypothetical protein
MESKSFIEMEKELITLQTMYSTQQYQINKQRNEFIRVYRKCTGILLFELMTDEEYENYMYVSYNAPGPCRLL